MSVTASFADGVRLEAVTKSYGTVQALRGVDFSISPGETVALLGPNGAGKSTAIDIMLGLSPAGSGRASVFGLPPQQAVKAGFVGGMLQTGTLPQYLTIGELVGMVASLYPRPRPVAEVLAVTGLTELAGRRTNKLSGGQSQRVRAAVALVGDPELLVLDEPTASLDVESRRAFWDVIKVVAAKGKTIIFATHYLEEADSFADRVILVANGRVVADGPATAIKARVGGRQVRATLPDISIEELGLLPGVNLAERRGDGVFLSCSDSDSTLRALLNGYPMARDIEVVGFGLEEAFLQLTGPSGETEGATL